VLIAVDEGILQVARYHTSRSADLYASQAGA
jgi:hypothetical protein